MSDMLGGIMLDRIYQMDCLEGMKLIPDASVDAVVTDPPYGLSFMGKGWDTFGGNKQYAEWVEQWARECLRILKPGGHLLAFSGTRTYHALAWGVESAGFEIRDMIEWLYVSGFPKSMDVGKQFDNVERGKLITRKILHFREQRDLSREQLAQMIGVGSNNVWDWEIGGHSPGERRWNDIKFKLGVSDEEERQFERAVIKTTSKAASTYYTQNVGESVLRHDTYNITSPTTPLAKQWDGWGTALKPAHEPIVMARKPFAGAVSANVEQYGTGAVNVDGCRIATDEDLNGGAYRNGGERKDGEWKEQSGFKNDTLTGKYEQPQGRFPANCITDDDDAWYSKYFNVSPQEISKKASKRDRNISVDGVPIESDNHHPTVKPVDLMAWLVRLVTPPNGIVLDPFTGSGTTCVAAARGGFTYIGFETEPDYIRIANMRLENVEE